LRQSDAITPLLFNPLNGELNSIYHLLSLLGAYPILHVSRIRVNVVLETAIRRSKVETREIIFDKRSQIMSPADGGVIVRRRLQSVKEVFTSLVKETNDGIGNK
jgi:hypothetical protein